MSTRRTHRRKAHRFARSRPLRLEPLEPRTLLDGLGLVGGTTSGDRVSQGPPGEPPVAVRDWYTTDDGLFTSNVDIVSITVKPSSVIRGTVWNDLNGDQVKDPHEPELAGWMVYLDRDPREVPDGSERFATTDQRGVYEFAGLASGTYTVAEVLRPAWEQTSPAGRHPVVLGADQTVEGVDFGNRRLPPTAVHDQYSMEEDSILLVGEEYGLMANDVYDFPIMDVMPDVRVESGPVHGQLTLHLDGSFIYAPDPDFYGTDTFTYILNDYSGYLCNAGTVTITVAPMPDPPEPVPFYFSLETDGTVDGLAVANEDIVVFDGADLALYFDGSDVGLRNMAIDALAVIGENEILLSFVNSGSVPGIGSTVDNSDLVKFTATRLGPNTAGSFELYFDGSDVGLDVAAENVDAIEMLEDGRLVVSTSGSMSAPGASGRDEDLFVFTPTSLGPNTAGTWALYFDGSDVGLGREDVDAVATDDHGNLLLSTDEDFSVDGLRGADEDVFLFEPTTLGPATAGTYAGQLYFNGSRYGLSRNDLVAVDLAPNHRPVAAGEVYGADPNDVLNVAAGGGVLVNDSDPDGDPLKAALVDGPMHGTLVLGVDGSFTYVPHADFVGIDEFTYRADDGRLESNPAQVTLVVAESLGPVDFLQRDHQDPSAGEIWYRCTTTHDAFLTVEAIFDDLGGDAEIALYDEDLVEVGTPWPTYGIQSKNHRGAAGETYYLRLSGSNSDVTLRLANLVQASLDGSQLTVYGTAGDDAFEFDADPGAGSVPHLFYIEITINGVRYAFPYPMPLFSAAFDGGEGDDTAVLRGSSGADTAQLWPGSGVLDGDGYHVAVDSVESITVQSGGGADVALLHDQPGAADTFKATPAYARLYGEGFDNRVESFRYAHGYGTPGDLDVAYLFGDPDAADRFEAWPRMARLQGDEYYNRVKDFRYVHAYGDPGHDDVALLYGEPGAPDVFEAWPQMARLRGTGYYNRVKSFRYVHAYGNEGDDDAARFYDRPGEYDIFEAWPHMARMYGDTYYNRAKSFRDVQAQSTVGDPDVAVLWDSALDDLLEAQDDWARLQSDSPSLDFLCQVFAFDTVTATSTTGNDTARVAPEVDFLILYGGWKLEPWSIYHPTTG